MELTNHDLLEDVPRFKVDPKAKEPLEPTDMEKVRASFNLPTFEQVRDRAIFEVHMATAFRYDTVLAMPLAALDKVSGKITVETKGGKVMHGRIDPKAMAHVRKYLQLRSRLDTECPALFVAEVDGAANGRKGGCRVCGGHGPGHALSYHGGRMVWRRMQVRSGVDNLGPHWIRHTYAQSMARRGAPMADIQDVLGHSSDKMARHYAGEARQIEAANLMAKYRLAS